MYQHTVELHAAWVWDCDNCGQENFERAIAVEGGMREKLEAEGEIPENAQGDFLMAPDLLICKHCGAQFEAEFPGDE